MAQCCQTPLNRAFREKLERFSQSREIEAIKFALWGIGTHLTEIRDVAMEELVVKHHPAAWEQGFRAGEIGNSPFESPFRAGTAAAWSWHKGFVDGEMKRRGCRYGHSTLDGHGEDKK
jgi:hypothetical protein